MTLLVLAALLLGPSDQAAQAHVRVMTAHSVVWRLSSATPLTTVETGTELEVLGRDANWYVVRLPQQQGLPAGEVGRIAVSQVELIDGGPVRAVSIRRLVDEAARE